MLYYLSERVVYIRQDVRPAHWRGTLVDIGPMGRAAAESRAVRGVGASWPGSRP